MWTRAVWREGKREVEGVVPDTWVEEVKRTLRWPRTTNAEKAVSERWTSKDNWWSFHLIKVKTVADNKTDAELYDETSTYDGSTDHEERGLKSKRFSKEREFPDHLTGKGLQSLNLGTKKTILVKRKGISSPSIIDELPKVPNKVMRMTDNADSGSRKANENTDIMSKSSSKDYAEPGSWKANENNSVQSKHSSKGKWTCKYCNKHYATKQLKEQCPCT